MKEKINNALKILESEKEIKILYAVESGSRAWGFASTDSDWDVRFIYVHKPEWYFQIDEQKDSLEIMLPGDLDLSGWELKKALRLFRKSNPPLLEWLRSPIVYYEDEEFTDKIKKLKEAYFNPKSCLYHYLHMAEKNFKAYLQKDIVRVKKYFYVLRPILACEWIRRNNTMAPMEFETLLNSEINDPILREEIDKLLLRKMNGEEMKEEPQIPLIQNYLKDRIDFFNSYLNSFDYNQRPETPLLNQLFKETIVLNWGRNIV